MYFGSLDPLAVAVLVEAMRSGFPAGDAPLRARRERPGRVAAMWKRLAAFLRGTVSGRSRGCCIRRTGWLSAEGRALSAGNTPTESPVTRIHS